MTAYEIPPYMTAAEETFYRLMCDKGIRLDFIGHNHASKFALNARYSLNSKTYKPDFHLPGTTVYYEVIGSRCAFYAGKQKYLRFRELYPNLTLHVVTANGISIDLTQPLQQAHLQEARMHG